MSDQLELVDLAGLVVPRHVEIPASLESLELGLNQIGSLLAAGGWATAAAIYAWTEPQPGRRSDLSPNGERLSLKDFAIKKLRGLEKIETVSKYRRRWEQGVDEGRLAPVKPGDFVVLPTEPFSLPRGSVDPDGDEWFTPRWVFDGLGLVFAIDVCGPEDRTYVSVPCETYYFKRDEDDPGGLALDWYRTVWCNPPYSDPEPWARRMIEHGDGLLLSHMPINAEWCVEVWDACDGFRLFQAMELVRPDGTTQRPGYWLQLAAFGDVACDALARLEAPDEIAVNPRRVPSPMWVRA